MLTTLTSTPSTFPSIPFPVKALKSSAFPSSSSLSLASFTIPVAIGCSEFCSRLAAIFRSSSSSCPSEGTISVTPNSPFVRVPVLSNTTASRFLAPSKLALFLIRSPCFAESVVETATTSGDARPSAWGQVITITVTIRSRAISNP